MAILIHRRSTIAPSQKAMNQYNYTPYQFGALACLYSPAGDSESANLQCIHGVLPGDPWLDRGIVRALCNSVFVCAVITLEVARRRRLIILLNVLGER